MKKMHHILWLVLISTLIIVLAACGSGGNGNSETSSGSNSSTDPKAGDSVAAGDPVHGKELFVGTCMACHGEGGTGIEGLGKDMTTSTFIKSLSDEELLAFIKVGRSMSDPDNTTGVDMPLKGGNPALTDDDIMDIISYMRTLEK